MADSGVVGAGKQRSKKKIKGNEIFNYNIRKLQNATGFTLFVRKVIITSMTFPLSEGFQAFSTLHRKPVQWELLALWP